jgi:hypothetical protein
MIEQASLVIGNGNWAVKSDSLLGYKTIDGEYYPREFTFTRATTGTRVNEAGLVEVVPYNLLQYSEQFDNASWGKASTTATANTAISPNGIMDADTYTAIGNSSVKQIFTNLLLSASTNYTLSIYAKKDTNDFIQFLSSSGTFGGGFYVNFDLQNGVIGQYNGALSAPKITDVGDGWYRCEASVVSVASPTVGAAMSISLITSATSPRAETNSLSTSVFLWGAQLVQGTEPLDYLPTTDRLDIARIDYSAGEPALLLEPQRTNVWVNSDDFNAGTFSSNLITYTANTTETTAPNGTNTADKFEVTTSGGDARRRFTRTIAIQNFSLSLYVKGAAGQKFQLFLARDSFAELKDITTTLNGEWQRIVLNDSFSTTSSTVVMGVEFGFTSDDSVAGQIYYLWGAQLEAGSYPTSYIPTTSASVTRNADVCSKTGISDLIGQTEGTMFIEMASPTNSVVSNYFSISDGTYANRVSILFSSGTNYIRSFLRVNSISQFDLTASGLNITEMNKIAFAYRQNDFAMYVNGVLIGQSNTGDTFNPNTLSIVSFSEIGSSLGQLNARVNQATLYKERLSDSELATLTTI